MRFKEAADDPLQTDRETIVREYQEIIKVDQEMKIEKTRKEMITPDQEMIIVMETLRGK